MKAIITRIYQQVRRGILQLMRPDVVKHHGVKLSLCSSEISPYIRKTIYTGAYETKEALLLRETLGKQDRVLELGSGMGFIASLSAKLLGDGAKVHAVEALPHMESVIRENFEINGVSPELTMAVVGKKEGQVEFSVSTDFWSSSVNGVGKSERKILVPMISLSKLIASFQPTYLVVDIEGAEEYLFDCDLGSVVKICLEVHPHYIGDTGVNHAIQALFKQGFVIDYLRMSKGMLYLYR